MLRWILIRHLRFAICFCGHPFAQLRSINPILTLSPVMASNQKDANVTTETYQSPEARVTQLKLELPPAPKAMGVYKPVIVIGNMAYVSGHGPLKADGSLITGRVGADLDLAAGKAAARQTGLTILATLRAGLGSLDRVQRLVKVLGMVNSTPDFGDHPKVINGCSELFAEVFGPELGVGARSAVGMGSLPSNIAVEIEAIFELR